MEVLQRGMHLPLSTEDRNGNDIQCSSDPSPDSMRSISSLSDGSTDSPPDVEMLECCLSDRMSKENLTEGNTFINGTFSPSVPEETLFRENGVDPDKTSIVDYVNTHIANWNQNMTFVITGLQNGHVDSSDGTVESKSGTVEASGGSVDCSPDSAERAGLEGSCKPLHHGSSENGSSVSSGEMVLRTNSFVLHESDQLFSISILEGSTGSSIMPSDLGMLSGLLPDVCEGFLENLAEAPGEVAQRWSLGATFIQPNDQASSLEDDNRQTARCLSITFCEPKEKSSSVCLLATSSGKFECVTPVQCLKTHSDAEKLQGCTGGSAQLTPAEGKSFILPASEDLDSSCNAQTSTPVQSTVQSVSNKTFCVPSLTESPFMDQVELGSPIAHTSKEQRTSVTSNSVRVTKTLMATANKSTKVEIKRLPNTDFSNIKSKIASRPPNPSRPSSLTFAKASPNNPSQVNESHAMKTPQPSRCKSSVKSILVEVPKPVLVPVRGVPKKEEGPRRGRSYTSDHDGVAIPKAQLRRWSESSSTTKTSRDTPPQSEARVSGASVSFITTKAYLDITPSKVGTQSRSAQLKQANGNAPENTVVKGLPEEPCGEFRKISLVTVSSKPAAAACDWSRGRPGARPSPGRARGSTAASQQPPAASLRLPPPVSKLKLGAAGKDGCSSTASMPSPRSRLNNTAGGNPKMRLTEGPSAAGPVGASAKHSVSAAGPVGASAKHSVSAAGPVGASAKHSVSAAGPVGASAKHSVSSVNGVRHSVNTPRSASKLPVKHQALLKSPSTTSSQTSSHNRQDYGEPSAGVLGKAASSKVAGLRGRQQTHPAKSTTSVGPGCKSTSSSTQGPTKSAASSLKRTASTRLVRPTVALSVEKNKPRASPRSQPTPHANGHPDLVAPPESRPRGAEFYQALCEKKNQSLQQLKSALVNSNRRFEAIAVALQHLNTEREEAMKQRRELSLELVTLRGELVSSAHSCERLEQDKEELRAAFDGMLQKVQEQHQSDLSDLEERLKAFYSAEWEKVHQVYQDEADKCKAQMEEQLEDLRSKHKVLRKDLEASHAEKMESIKQQYEESFEELRKAHKEEMQTLDKTLKEVEATLSGQIQELATENSSLNEKLKAEENRRRELAEKSQDSHTLYLEQELESLKVVLDIKNIQLHQQDKKLMQIDKLMEKNFKLDECLKKVQQENEDFRARMDKHAALSRQLSTEQAVLQESLQKESKVNKRLSMENEELLWKLHNGDLSSPRKLSPTSPSMTLQSPRNSDVFSSPPVSPR